MRRIVLLLTWGIVAWALGPQPVQAQQTGSVQGRVITESGQPLAGAQVSLEGTDLGGLTNNSGRYLVLNVPAGEHTISVTSMGYGTAEATIAVEPGEVTTQDFRVGEEAVALDEMTVTVGSRAGHTAADELPVPVDVYPSTQLEATNSPDFLGAIMEIAPSVWVPQEQISDLASGLRPFQLRGMSPDQALVLVNGMRRHHTASVMVFGSSRDGSSGVDMNAIPTMAVKQMELLRDGASAQYGSDAMAGVINLELKDEVNPLTVQGGFGKYYPDAFPNDGFRTQVSANWGFEVPGIGGVLNVTGQYAKRNPTDRAGHSDRDQVVEGDGDVVDDIDGDGAPEVVEKNNPVPQPTFWIADGDYENEMLWANYERDLARGDHQLYVYGGWSDRTDVTTCFRRRGLETRNWKEIYPHGFMPAFDADTRDMQVTPGLTGEMGDWTYDVAGSFGQNRVDNTMTNTLNASLGPCLGEPCAPGRDGILGTEDDPGLANKHKFYAGAIQNSMYTGRFTVGRALDVGMRSPLTLTLGGEVRAENYKILPGEIGSWVNGFHPNQEGGIAASGAQCFSGWRGPEAEAMAQGSSDVTDDWRSNVGAFAEGEVELTDQLLANAAVRFESYSDFGESVTGKLATRFQPMEDLIFRASASTGFRAPTVSQKNWTHVSTGFTETEGGNQVAIEIGEFPAGSPEAQALGARPLQEETSTNLAGGIAWTPVQNLNLTADGYWIDVQDAILLSTTISGDLVEEVLREFQASSVKYPTNALDLRHAGVDLTANYRWLLAEEMFLEFNTAFNLQRTEVTSAVKTPDVLVEIGEEFYSRGGIDEIENERPSERARGTVLYRWGDFRLNGTVNFFGETGELINTDPDIFQSWPSKTTLDAELSWRFQNGLRFSIGGENLTDVMPTADPRAGPGEDGQWGFNGIFWNGSPFPWINGRYIYTNLRYTFQ